MKHLNLFIFLNLILCLTSCEKHDGEFYFSSKCTAELNGKMYIDQIPFTAIFSPGASRTPICEYGGEPNLGYFNTALAVNRKSATCYYIHIYIAAESIESFLAENHPIEIIETDSINSASKPWEYHNYCMEHGISYASINNEIVKRGSFQITSYEKKENWYEGEGIFTLYFSEGTIKGQFSCNINAYSH